MPLDTIADFASKQTSLKQPARNGTKIALTGTCNALLPMADTSGFTGKPAERG